MIQKALREQDQLQIFHAAAVWGGHFPPTSRNECQKNKDKCPFLLYSKPIIHSIGIYSLPVTIKGLDRYVGNKKKCKQETHWLQTELHLYRLFVSA